jgi:redox-sensitive bicupin YhaK (pirin superfamily)
MVEASTLLPREVPLGGQRAMLVRRTLPHREIRMIGAFCFVDHYGPSPTVGPEGHPMTVPPHPHTGLQTVSWLLSGTIDHRDSVGSVQRIRAGELNLMTAGRGIAHSEYSHGVDQLHGVQLWVALPDQARNQDPHFEHHGDLPFTRVADLGVRVLMGSVGGETSGAMTYSGLLCAELDAPPGRHLLPLNTVFEHGLLPVDHNVEINGVMVPRSAMRHVPEGPDGLVIVAREHTRLLLVGGEPFPEDLLMWWNFVGRDHDEIEAARMDWQNGRRFGAVTGDVHPPIPAPPVPTVRLRPRPARRR